jgi:glycosyltransferase involved in cell wall biosynthesis
MKLTIVTAVHNRIDGLKKVIECLKNQTNQDFEHIIVDDCSEEIDYNGLVKLCEENPRTHFVRLGFRSHFYGCFSRVIGTVLSFCYIHHSKRDIENEWVTYIDTDNLWKENHIQSAIDILKDNPNVNLIATDAEWVGANDKNWKEIRQCKIRQGSCDIGQFFYKTSLFRKYGYWFAHDGRKQKWDYELIKKMYDGEYNQDPKLSKVAFTHQPTFIMSYRKK